MSDDRQGELSPLESLGAMTMQAVPVDGELEHVEIYTLDLALLQAGAAGKGGASAKGKNNEKKLQESLPIGVWAALNGNTAPTIQMVTSDGFCVGAKMTEVKKDEPKRYLAQKR